MAYTSLTEEFDDLVSFTYKHIGQKKVVSSVFEDLPLLKYLMKGDRYRAVRGGTRIQELVSLEEPNGPTAINAYDPIDITPFNSGESAFFNWAHYARGVTISAKELALNDGDERIVGMLEQRFALMGEKFRDVISDALWANADDSGNPVALIGMRYNIADDPSTTSVGQIATSKTNWRNQAATLAATGGSASFSTSNSGVKALRRFVTQCMRNGSAPDLIIGPEDGWHAYQDATAATGQTLIPAGVGDLGFQTLNVSGVPFIFDRAIPGSLAGSDGRFYYFNTKNMWLNYHPDHNFTMSSAREPQNALTKTYPISWMGQVSQNKRKSQGVLTSAAA